MTLDFAFRVDAGLDIGTGHTMRCLTLADALARAGGECHFLVRPLPGHLMDAIRERGHAVHVLPLLCGVGSGGGGSGGAGSGDAAYGDHPAPPPHAAWLQGDWRGDARASHAVLERLRPDWLILDHYALDRNWEALALPPSVRLAVIDDLADRPHLARLLLDQNAGRGAGDYAGLLPEDGHALIGPRFALLRPEFAALREKALARRGHAETRHLLITLGGVDRDNATGRVLAALAAADLPPDMAITVVLGPNAPWRAEVERAARGMPGAVRVLSGVSDMAGLMAEADICIGAAGTTAWERCALGLPTLLMALADNQRPIQRALIAAGACLGLPDAGDAGFATALARGMAQMLDRGTCRTLSGAAAGMTKGDGCATLCNYLISQSITLRPARMPDARFVWQCRNDGDAWRHYRIAEPTPLEDHLRWFQRALARDDLQIWIAANGAGDFGYLRLDRAEVPHTEELSLGLAGRARGQGLGSLLIAHAVMLGSSRRLRRLTADVHRENAASRKAFLRSGFSEIAQTGDMLNLAMDIA